MQKTISNQSRIQKNSIMHHFAAVSARVERHPSIFRRFSVIFQVLGAPTPWVRILKVLRDRGVPKSRFGRNLKDFQGLSIVSEAARASALLILLAFS